MGKGTGVMARRERYAKTLQLSVARLRQRDAEHENTGGIAPRNFADWGLEIHPQMLQMLDDVDRRMFNVRASLSNACSALRELQQLPVQPEVAKILDTLDQAGRAIGKLRPRGMCPDCKGLPGLKLKCKLCDTRGWLGMAEYDHEMEFNCCASTEYVRVDGVATRIEDYAKVLENVKEDNRELYASLVSKEPQE